MKQERFKINNIPAILWGSPSDQVFLFIHGQGGYKEAAEPFAEIAAERGWQVLSIDLPEHGGRSGEKNTFYPWNAVPELQEVIRYAKQNWKRISLRADSIGAWFSMLAFADETLEKCLFVSPVLDMEQLILNMMRWAGVTEEQLQQQKIIPTDFGQTLSWEYLCYVRQHPVAKWDARTHILYAGRDDLTQRSVVDAFVDKYNADLSVMDDGEHWFHTPEQLAVLDEWTREHI